MKKSVSLLTLINIAQMFSSLIIQILIALVLGVNVQRDSLFIAMSIPLFINVILTSSVSFMLTPITIHYKSLRVTKLFYNKVLTAIFFIVIIICFFLYLQGDNIIGLLAPGFGQEELKSTKKLLIYCLLMIPIQAISSIINSFWITIEKTLFPSLSLLLGNLITIFGIIYLGDKLNANSAIKTILLGYVLTFIVTTAYYIIHTYKNSNNHEENKPFENIKLQLYPFLRQAILLLILLLINRSANIFESRFASTLDVGTISNLRYAAYIVTFGVNAISTPVITVYYAELCKLWNDKAWDKISIFFENGILTLSLVSSIIASICTLSISELLMFFLPMTKFTSTQLMILSSYIKISMITLILLSLSNFLGRVFYISNKFVLVALIDVLVLVSYIFFSKILVGSFEGYGLSISYCIYSICIFIAYLFVSKNSFNIEFSKIFWLKFSSIILINLVSFLLGYVAKNLLNTTGTTILGSLIGSMFFFVSLIILLIKFRLKSYLPFLDVIVLRFTSSNIINNDI
jgi:putative peptidoglycan lipid II flippase